MSHQLQGAHRSMETWSSQVMQVAQLILVVLHGFVEIWDVQMHLNSHQSVQDTWQLLVVSLILKRYRFWALFHSELLQEHDLSNGLHFQVFNHWTLDKVYKQQMMSISPTPVLPVLLVSNCRQLEPWMSTTTTTSRLSTLMGWKTSQIDFRSPPMVWTSPSTSQTCYQQEIWPSETFPVSLYHHSAWFQVRLVSTPTSSRASLHQTWQELATLSLSLTAQNLPTSQCHLSRLSMVVSSLPTTLNSRQLVVSPHWPELVVISTSMVPSIRLVLVHLPMSRVHQTFLPPAPIPPSVISSLLQRRTKSSRAKAHAKPTPTMLQVTEHHRQVVHLHQRVLPSETAIMIQQHLSQDSLLSLLLCCSFRLLKHLVELAFTHFDIDRHQKSKQ